MDYQRLHDEGVSPVVGVVLMVAVTVILSAIVGTFVFNLGETVDSSGTAELGVSTSEANGVVTIQVVTGTADELIVFTDGSISERLSNPQPGDTLTEHVSGSESITVASVTAGERKIISSTDATGNITPPSAGLISFWTFDDASSSGRAVDIESGYNASFHGDAGYTSDAAVGSHAVTFDGNGDYAMSPNGSEGQALSFTGNFTVTLWFKSAEHPDDWSGQPLLQKVDNSTWSNHENYALLVNANGKFQHNIERESDDKDFVHATTWTAPNESWQHAVLVRKNNTKYVYINGQLEQTAPANGTPYHGDTGLRFGAFGHHNGQSRWWYNGSIDNVRVYDRPLNASEVSRLQEWGE